MENKVQLDGGVSQGYPDDQGATLAADITKLKDLYMKYPFSENPTDNDVTHLKVGEACAAVLGRASEQLTAVRKAFVKMAPDETVPDEIEVKMGPLKKVARIMQKAAHYAVEKDLDTLQLGRVVDILRGTIVLPLSFLREKGIGGRMIDAVDTAFGGQVVQVKNRFIQKRYPKLMEYNGQKMSDQLVEDIVAQADAGLRGRDTFYRDFQLLVKLPNGTFPNGKNFGHVVMEIQLASKPLYEAKVSKNPNMPSGHDMYKIIRAVSEHCEYHIWTKGETLPRKLSGAWQYYPPPPADHWENFTRYLAEMWDMYRSVEYLYTPHFDQAIYESKWYASNKKRIK